MRRRGACAHAICNSGAAWRPSTLSSAAQGSMPPPLPVQLYSESRCGAFFAYITTTCWMVGPSLECHLWHIISTTF